MASLVALLPELLGGAEGAAAGAEGAAAGGAAGGIMNFISKAGTIARQMNPVFQMASAFMPSQEHEPYRPSAYQSDFSY